VSSLINRYLHDVTKRLPEKLRADVERELRSNIEDMLPDDPAEEDVVRVLTELGSPAKLAAAYRPNPRYLISPQLFDDYLTVLKIVAVTLAAILAALGVFRLIFANELGANAVETIAEVLTSFISGAVTGIVHAFFWVTLIFAIFEYVNVKKQKDEWTPKNLPDIPVSTSAVIKRSDAVAGAIFSTLFSAVFLIGTLREPPFIAWYEAGQATVPLFTVGVVRQFMPLFVFLIALNIIVAVVKAIAARWNTGTAFCHILYQILSAAVGISFLSKPGFLNTAFLSRFAEKLSIELASLQNYIRISVTVLIVLIVIGTAADIITTIVKTVKGYRPPAYELS
jgi:hypothetical protein